MGNNTVLITGVDGFLGGKITRRILDTTELRILGLTMSLEWAENMLKRENIDKTDRITFLPNNEFLSSGFDTSLYGAIHLAFSRRMQPAEDIASSIVFASQVFRRLAELGTDRVIYMSSQGIYGNTNEIRTEDTPPAPATQYTMAKYAAEVLFHDILRDTEHHTALRLDPVAQSQNVLKGLCKSAKEGKISLKGGKQVFSFIDANDVPEAVVAMLTAEGTWDHVYNVGWNEKRYTLTELARMVADAASACGLPEPQIELQEAEIELWAGMNSSRFTEKTGWRPQIELHRTLKEMIMNS